MSFPIGLFVAARFKILSIAPSNDVSNPRLLNCFACDINQWVVMGFKMATKLTFKQF